ncbi:MAG: hypothetical protein R6V67_01700 [Spirochaetia bacterium]
MIRVAKPSDPKKIEYLKKKINDKQYLSTAIKSIATTLTKELLHIKEE